MPDDLIKPAKTDNGHTSAEQRSHGVPLKENGDLLSAESGERKSPADSNAVPTRLWRVPADKPPTHYFEDVTDEVAALRAELRNWLTVMSATCSPASRPTVHARLRELEATAHDPSTHEAYRCRICGTDDPMAHDGSKHG